MNLFFGLNVRNNIIYHTIVTSDIFFSSYYHKYSKHCTLSSSHKILASCVYLICGLVHISKKPEGFILELT